MNVFRKPDPVRVTAAEALPGRDHPVFLVPERHEVTGERIVPPLPAGLEVLYVAMGCFWGAERIFWRLPGVVTTAVGYQGGYTPNPTYEEVCTGGTGHAEVTLVAYDPQRIDAEHVLQAFWENHDPTTPDRQGNDVGTQYRSAIHWTTPEQHAAAIATRDAFQQVLTEAGHGQISTEIRPVADGVDADGLPVEGAGEFYYAEDYHQQYLHKNPGGYCNHGPNGLSCPVGLVRQDAVPSQESVLGRD